MLSSECDVNDVLYVIHSRDNVHKSSTWKGIYWKGISARWLSYNAVVVGGFVASPIPHPPALSTRPRTSGPTKSQSASRRSSSPAVKSRGHHTSRPRQPCAPSQGLTDVARHVINRTLSPRPLIQMAPYDGVGGCCSPCHTRSLNPRIMSQMALYDVVSNIRPALSSSHPTHLEPSSLESNGTL
jgi:hypothetical protein